MRVVLWVLVGVMGGNALLAGWIVGRYLLEDRLRARRAVRAYRKWVASL